MIVIFLMSAMFVIMKRFTTLSALPVLWVLVFAILSPVNGAEENTRLEDIVDRGTVQELKDWLKTHDNKITAKHRKLWEVLDSRLGDGLMVFQKMKDPLATQNERDRRKKEYKAISDEFLAMTDLVLKASDQSALNLLNASDPPHDAPLLSNFLTGACMNSSRPPEVNKKIIALFTKYTKGKIWFEDWGLFTTYLYTRGKKWPDGEQKCMSDIAEDFVHPKDWPVLKDREKAKALIKKITKLYKR